MIDCLRRETCVLLDLMQEEPLQRSQLYRLRYLTRNNG